MSHQSTSMPRSRKWFGTVWNMQDLAYIKNLKTQYIIISALDRTAEEKEGVQREHWHVFLQFKSNRTPPATKNTHWEIPKHITSCVEYCRKKGEPTYEAGDLAINTADKEDWEGFVSAA